MQTRMARAKLRRRQCLLHRMHMSCRSCTGAFVGEMEKEGGRDNDRKNERKEQTNKKNERKKERKKENKGNGRKEKEESRGEELRKRNCPHRHPSPSLLAILDCSCRESKKVISKAQTEEDLFDIAFGLTAYALAWSVGVSHLGKDEGAFKRRSLFEACMRQLLGEHNARQRWKMPGSIFAHDFDPAQRLWLPWAETTQVQKLVALADGGYFVFPPSALHLQGGIRAVQVLSKHGKSRYFALPAQRACLQLISTPSPASNRRRDQRWALRRKVCNARVCSSSNAAPGDEKADCAL